MPANRPQLIRPTIGAFGNPELHCERLHCERDLARRGVCEEAVCKEVRWYWYEASGLSAAITISIG
jgi:hypothetical protein